MAKDLDIIRDLENENGSVRREAAELPQRIGTLENQEAPSEPETISFNNFGLLVAGIVHDLRGGLGIIRNIVGFMEDDLVDSAYQADLRKISRSLDFCELVLRNLSTLGGQDIFQPQAVKLKDIVEEVFSILERKLVDVTLVVETDHNVPEILADEGQMKQVFMNLVKNAGEAMPDGGTLTFRTCREGRMLRVEVSDTGCGISPQDQERLFHEFFTTKDRGYGLGLHIVHMIVKRHGGTIEVESKEGKGSTFLLHLPIE